jgi:hypothetical protein
MHGTFVPIVTIELQRMCNWRTAENLHSETVWKFAQRTLNRACWVAEDDEMGLMSPSYPLVEALTSAYPDFPNSFSETVRKASRVVCGLSN